MHSTTFRASVLATAALISTTFASPILETRTVARRGFTQPKLVTYWGNGFDQMRLGDFCTNTTLDVIPIGFVNSFPDEDGNNGFPGTNYANACGGEWTAPDGTQTKMFTSCWQIEEDIPKCQALGKKILASLGGHAPNNKITSKESAIKFAQFLWASYGPLVDPTLTQFPRPFGKSVVVDGFDLDIENGGGFGYADVVNELRRLAGSQPLIISAAPQCFTNDPQLADAIQNSVIDYVWVQYYNSDPCSAASLFNSGTLNKNTDVSFGWVDWLKTNSMNKNIQLYLGLPASPAGANPGFYLDLAKTTALIEEFSCNPKYQGVFGGVMLWEATESARNTQANGLTFADNIKAAFNKLSCIPVVTTTTTTTTTTTKTTTTTTAPPAPTTTTTTTTTTTYEHPRPTTTTTTEAAPTTTTTTTSEFPHGPHPTTTSEAVPTTSTTTAWTTSEFPHGPHPTTTSEAPVTTTTTSENPRGPHPTTTSEAIPTTTTTTYELSHGPHPTTSSAAPTTTTTTTSRPHGPGGETSSTTTTSHVVGPATSSSSTGNTWEDWTSSSSSLVAPTSTTARHWTTTSKPVDPAKTSSTTTVDETWLDWTSSTTVAPATTTSKPHRPTVTTTIWTTHYTDWDWDRTTIITRTYTATTTITVYPGTTAAPWVWPTDANGCPHGFTTTIVTVENPPVTSTITLTVPIPTKPAAPYTAGPSTGVAPTAPGAPHAFAPSSTAVAPIVTNPPSPASTSATGVKPANVATFTGAAAQAQLPGTVMSVAVCLAVAVAGLLF